MMVMVMVMVDCRMDLSRIKIYALLATHMREHERAACRCRCRSLFVTLFVTLSLAEGVTTISGAVVSADAVAAVRAAIDTTNANGKCCPSNAAKVQKFTILAQDFSSSTGELTPTLKTKRSVVEKINADAIEKMYASKDVYVV